MKVVSEFPVKVRELENVWIPMPDGVHLAARVWMPDNAEAHPVPAILELIPYRKRDGMARRDEMMHPYFAGHGYAAVRVDLRGAGDSEGLLEDEYAPQEQKDGLAIIAWLSKQTWCSGAVGMIGISWGGFNGLQIAAHRPPALKAVISVGSTDDRYADDVHYMGGCLLTAKFTWAQTFFSDLSRPPDPLIVGDRWKDMWLERLEKQTFFIDRWLRHQTRDSFWKHGSIREDYSAIECPVFAVGGWSDSYTNTVMRLIENLKCERLGLIGPWGHDYPHTAIPGPAIGFLQECLRWWDRWLKKIDTGIMNEPVLRIWMQDEISPTPDHVIRPGRWVGLDKWPVEGSVVKTLHLGQGGLGAKPQPTATLTHSSPQTLGAAAGEWCPYGICADQPADQGEDDGQSLIFDTPPLEQAVEILGTPVLEITVAVDKPLGLLAVRLNDIDSSGRSARVSYGLLNLTHRDGHEVIMPAKPGEPIKLRIKLCDTAYSFARGHRIRIAISTAYWPTVWPSPEQCSLTLFTGSSALHLPVPTGISQKPVSFLAPEGPAPVKRELLKAGEMRRSLHRDYITGQEFMEVVVDDGMQRIETHGLEVGRRCVERYFIHPDDPLSARIEADWTMNLGRGDWRIRTETRSVMTSSKEAFLLEAHLVAYVGNEEVFSRTFRSSVPRDGI